MRLLLVVNVSWFFISHRLPLARAALSAGFDVHVATRVASEADAGLIERAGIKLHNVAIGRGRAGLVADLLSSRQLYRLYREVQPDVLHLVTIKPILFGGLVARWAGVRRVVFAFAGLGHVFSSRSWGDRVRRLMILPLLRLATAHDNVAFIVQNGDDARLLSDLRIAKADRIVLVPGSGVDLRVFSATVETDCSRPRALFAARMLWSKGVADFVEAARVLKAQHPDWTFVLAGLPDPENPASVDESRLREWHNSGCVQWLGHVREMHAEIRRSSIVVLPTYYGEGVPKVLLEAAASARAAVASNIAGCREVVLHEVSGLLVPPRNVSALAKAMERLMEDPGLRARYGRAARALAESKFDVESIVERQIRVYTDF